MTATTSSSLPVLETLIPNENPTPINCAFEYNYNSTAGCMLRDDIEKYSQIMYFVYFLVYLALLFKSLRSLVIICRIHNRTPSLNMSKINRIMFLFLITQLVFYSDGPLQLFFNRSIPLYIYLWVERIGIILLNTVLCLGGYVWIMTVFMVTLYNKYKVTLTITYSLLLVSNFFFSVYFTIIYFYQKVYDIDSTSTIPKNYTLVTPICTIVSTGLNGLFFAMGCLLLRGYIRKNLYQNSSNEGLVLTKLSYAGVFIAGVRVLQNTFEVWQIPERIKRNSAYGDTGTIWWAIYGAIYLGIVNLLPTLYFLKKYSPDPTRKIDDTTRASEIEGLVSYIIKSSDAENLEKDAKQLQLNSESIGDTDLNDALCYALQIPTRDSR